MEKGKTNWLVYGIIAAVLGCGLLFVLGAAGGKSTENKTIGEDAAINATLNDLCGFTNMTTWQAINLDGVHHVGSRYGPLTVGAYEYQWKSDYDPSLKADGYKVLVTYVGDEGEVKYEFHWDGETVRYMNPAARRALEGCE